MNRLWVLVIVGSVSLGAQAQQGALDVACAAAASASAETAREAFLVTEVQAIGNVWARTLDTDARKSLGRAVSQSEVDDLNSKWGRTVRESIPESVFGKVTKTAFEVIDGRLRLVASEAWYEEPKGAGFGKVAQFTQVTLPLTGYKVDPNEVYVTGTFRHRYGDPITYSGKMAGWLESQVPPACRASSGDSGVKTASSDDDSVGGERAAVAIGGGSSEGAGSGSADIGG